MGHHIDDQGRFQSDKHPDTPANRIRMNLENPKSLRALVVCAEDHHDDDPEFSDDLLACLRQIHGDEAVERAMHPLVVITVGGGKLTDESRQRIEEFAASEAAHRVQIVEQDVADVTFPPIPDLSDDPQKRSESERALLRWWQSAIEPHVFKHAHIERQDDGRTIITLTPHEQEEER